jgi:hypothetical protein
MTFIGLGFLLLAGCATMGPPGPVAVHTRMSNSVFLDVTAQTSKTIFIRCRGGSDVDPGIASDLQQALGSRLQAGGYTQEFLPQNAFFVVQADIRYVGERDAADMGTVLGAGFGGAVIGGILGGSRGEGLGLLAGLLAGSSVRDVTYALVTDIQITEYDANRDQFETRVVTYAGQTDLEFPRAEPALIEEQADAIARIF